MSKNLCRMIGLILMLVSVFFLLGGLYLGGSPLSRRLPRRFRWPRGRSFWPPG